jgi:beta-lactamase regulating signal transducer with metallopeptidase domain/thiol-disulfide isomerase/thioredoxin/protocatechuate 3,4-dioxygenase beta subunit
MIDVFGSASPGARAALAVALDAAVKGAALIALTLAAHAALGRRRALARSALWNACLAGLLLLPAAGLAFPRLRVTLLPAREAAPAEAPPRARVDSFLERAPAAEPAFETPSPAVATAPAVLEPAPSRPAPIAARVRRLDAAALVLGVYLAVAALLVLRLAASLRAVERLRRGCERVEAPAWTEALERWRSRLGIARRVALLASDRVSVPVVVGWLGPAVVLPRALGQSADERLVDAVLLHELAHVRRGDFGWNLALRLVQAVYWPHPLVWPVGWFISAVREQACDDLCVHVLGGAAGYRASLVEVASGLVRRPEPALGLAMARATRLGRRLAWIDRSRGAPRCLLRWPARVAVAASVMALAGVLGAVELGRAPARAAEGPKEPAAKPGESPKTQPASPPPAIEVVVRAKDTGKPLEGATVRPLLDLVTSERKTDRDGLVRIDLSGRRFQDNLNFDVWADGYVQQRHFFAQNDARYRKTPARFTVELLPGEETLGGRVTDEAGRPIAGVKVAVWGYLGEKKEPHELAYMVDAVTDGQGRWRCRCFRNMSFAYLYLSHPDYLADGDRHPRRHGQPVPLRQPEADERPVGSLRNFSDVQVMTRGVELAGTVADAQGKPVAGAEVGWLEANQRDTFHGDMPVTTTDATGRFRFPHARPGGQVLQVKARGHAPGLKTVGAREGMEPVAIELGPPRTLTGRVEDSRGQPIPDAFVVIDSWRGYRALGVFLKSDADGRFRWEEAPPDPVLVNASRTGYDSVNQRLVSPDEKEAVLTLRRSLSISGKVRDAGTGKSIERAEVEVGTPDPKTGAVAWVAGRGAFCFQGHLQATLDVEASPEYRLRIKAKGYAPFETRTFRGDEGQVEYDVALTKADRPEGVIISGIVRRPDGTPLEGAEVVITYGLGRERLPTVHIANGKIQPREDQPIVKTDARGRFTLGREPDPAGKYFAVVVVHPEFYTEVDRPALEADSTIIARPWGRVDGVARFGTRPAAGAEVRYSNDRLGNPDVPFVSDGGKTTADAEGRFVLERVAPGDVRVARSFAPGSGSKGWSYGALVEVRPGETVGVALGGQGRPVVAKVVPPAGFDPKADYTAFSEFEIESDRPTIPYPNELRARHDGSMFTWGRLWWASAEGHEYRRRLFAFRQANLRPDGTIRAEDVPPGEYRLRLTYTADPLDVRVASPERFAYATKQFTIPEVPGVQSDEPFDLGVLRPKPRAALKVGQAVPAFDVEALDGRRLTLADFRGKYLLLDFWATWCGPCVAEVPELRAVHEKFGRDGRFAMLSLSLDAKKDAPRKFVAEKGLAWTQGFLGDWPEGGVQDTYHVETIPSLFLIGPDGTLVAKDLRGDAIAPAVANALKAP